MVVQLMGKKNYYNLFVEMLLLFHVFHFEYYLKAIYDLI